MRTPPEPWPQVALVGAGPGDPGLLTLRGLRLLEAADVVIHDRLVAAAILDLIPARVERVDVGKRPGSVRASQAQIERMMIRLAGAGRRVVRLKGGDPFIFGRGSEELDACQAAGLSCEVVPGISSALAAPAAAGVPLTERGVARSFAVVTAETRDAGDIAQLRAAAAADTVVLMMTARRLPEVTRELIRLGRPADEPAAAIERATQPGQRVVAANLGTLAERVERHGLGAPMTVVIGAVARRARPRRTAAAPALGLLAATDRPAEEPQPTSPDALFLVARSPSNTPKPSPEIPR